MWKKLKLLKKISNRKIDVKKIQITDEKVLG